MTSRHDSRPRREPAILPTRDYGPQLHARATRPSQKPKGRPIPTRNPVTTPAAPAALNLAEKFALFDERWSPKIIAKANGWEIKLVKAQGSFVSHHHDIDEIFCVFSGRLTIHLQDQPDVHVHPGEIFVVPRGIEHRLEAEHECQLLLLEPAGVINTGQAAGALTAVDEWI